MSKGGERRLPAGRLLVARWHLTRRQRADGDADSSTVRLITDNACAGCSLAASVSGNATLNKAMNRSITVSPLSSRSSSLFHCVPPGETQGDDERLVSRPSPSSIGRRSRGFGNLTSTGLELWSTASNVKWCCTANATVHEAVAMPLSATEGIELLLDKMGKAKSNAGFLASMQKG